MTERASILVVDDEPASLALLASVLTEQGYEVRPADSGKLALASVASKPPELILLDMRMPDMDGLEVCRRLKARKESREIPVVFVSASADTSDHVEALTIGAVDFVTKPFQREELVARIRTHLELRRLQSQLEQQVARRTEDLVSAVKWLEEEIAERKRTEQALRESEERFRTMADTAPVMIVTADANKFATFFNRVWLDFTGRAMEQELGAGWLANVHPDDLDFCVQRLGASYAARRDCKLEYRLRRADGEYRFMMCQGVPRYESNGAFAGYIASLVDVTESKRNQLLLEEYRQRLQELTAGLLNAQETASRGLARELHDVFSQELVAVKMQISSLRLNAGCDDELGRHLAEIGNRIGRLARDIHRTSHNLHSSILDELGLIAALSDECEAFEERSGILTEFVAEKVPTVLPKDLGLCLYRVTQECLRNIGKHGVNTNAVHVSLTARLDGVALSIEDNGCGFDLEEARQKGGLGLISMEERVRLVNGSLSIRSAPGEGTVVEVVVSAAGQAA